MTFIWFGDAFDPWLVMVFLTFAALMSWIGDQRDTSIRLRMPRA